MVRADDAHDRALLAEVRPPAWANPEPAGRYHLVVIGAGTAGLVAAAGAATLGARVALIEKHLMGGDCLNYGCVPSKALLRSAHAAAEARAAGALGVRVGGTVEVDFPAVMERMRRLRASLARNDSAPRFRGLGADVYLGTAQFVARDAVEVDGRRLRFRRALIATGTRPTVPTVPGLEQAGYLTNETVFGLATLPRRLAVIGGGPIGCELAQAFRRFGSEVILIGRAPRLLPRDDPEAGALIEAQLGREGVRLLLGATLTRVERQGAAKLAFFEQAGAVERVEVDDILIGAGRTPSIESLGLDAAGVHASERGVEVDHRLRTHNRRIYAAGDVCSAFKFTHAADAMARVVVQNALFFGRKRASALVIPWCTYTDPEVAHVGLDARAAEARGSEVRTFTVPLAEVDRAVLDGASEGFARAHVDARSGRLLGATLVARHAGESIGELVLAIQAGLDLRALSATIHPYPTQADVLRRLGDAAQRARLTPRVRHLMARWFRLWQ